MTEVGGEGEREFRGGRRIEKGFGEGTGKREGRKQDKGGEEKGEDRLRREKGCSSVTACSTEHCNTARLFAIVPIQRLIRAIISQLLKLGLRYEMLQPSVRLIVILSVRVRVRVMA